MARAAIMARAAALWLLCSAASGAAVALLSPWLSELARLVGDWVSGTTSGTPPFDRLLVLVASVATAACASWWWVVVSLVTVEAVAAPGASTSRADRLGCPPALRRLVRAGCGLAVSGAALSALTGPALATPPGTGPDGDGAPAQPVALVLDGLPLPDRAAVTGPHPATSTSTSPATSASTDPPVRVVVHPGDSLWALAAASLGGERPGAPDPVAVTARWHAIYALNRAALGPDPDLILPGTTLRIPDSPEGPR